MKKRRRDTRRPAGSPGPSGPMGPRGPRGATGAAGARGQRGVAGTSRPAEPIPVLNKLDEQMSEVQRTLEIQFSRIAQLQQQIDELRAAWRNAKGSN